MSRSSSFSSYFSRFANQLSDRFISTDCSGLHSIDYRYHWYWTPFDVTCLDTCKFPPKCFAYGNDCVVVQDCQLYSYCTYSWTPVAADPVACVSAQSCNWLDCSLYGLNESTCETWCVNSSLSQAICLDCSSVSAATNYYCIEVTNLTQTECADGFCSLDSSIQDNASCAALTDCSLTITSLTVGLGHPSFTLNFPSGASDANTCHEFGACQSYADIQPLLSQFSWNASGASGICLSPVLENFCNGVYPPILEGCPEDAYLNQTSCQAAGYVWRTIATDQADCMILYLCHLSLIFPLLFDPFRVWSDC